MQGFKFSLAPDRELNSAAVSASEAVERKLDRARHLPQPGLSITTRTQLIARSNTFQPMPNDKGKPARKLADADLHFGDVNDTGLVFATRTGTPLDGCNVTRDFQRLLKNAKLPIRRLHDLRHTTVTLLLMQNVHPRAVMEPLGHAEIRTTLDTYYHVLPEVQADTAFTLARGQPRRVRANS